MRIIIGFFIIAIGWEANWNEPEPGKILKIEFVIKIDKSHDRGISSY